MWRWFGLVGMAIIGVFACMGDETASAKEIRFIAQDRATGGPVWGPNEVVTIDQKNDLKEPLYFILENTTGTDHEFAVHGLYELVTEQITTPQGSDYYTGPKTATLMRPIHVKIKAKTTLKIAVSTEGLIGDRDLGAKYRFFCPLHKDAHLGGSIFVN